MKRSALIVCIACLLVQPAAAQLVRKVPVLKMPTLKVLLPTSSTTWLVGKTAAVRWTKDNLPGRTVTINLVQATTLLPARIADGILLAANVPDSGDWLGKLGKTPAGRYRVCVTRGKQKAYSPIFRILTKGPQPDLVCSIDQVLFSTSSAGEFMGHDIYTTVTNLNHAATPVAAGAVIWLRIESQGNPAKHFDHQMTNFEVQSLHDNGSVQFTWNMALDMDMPQPWKLTVDSKHNIAESNEGNNTATGP